jgi:cytochrome o ubiquinol oxidase subunit II
MQSFFIPALGSQIYAMAGMRTKLHLEATSPGQFLGENTQYNGMGFQKQHFIAQATTLPGFRAWVADVKANGLPLTPGLYDKVRSKGTIADLTKGAGGPVTPGAFYFTDVPKTLFGHVIRSYHGGPATSAALLEAGMAGGTALAIPSHNDGTTPR